MSLILAILAQVGPFASPGAQPVSPLPPELWERKERASSAARALPPAVPDQSARMVAGQTMSPELSQCLQAVDNNPGTGIEAASAWLDKARGGQRAEAGMCLGLAQSGLQEWEEAQAAFLAARDAADTADILLRARIGAMAGNAALVGGEPAEALSALDIARADAVTAGAVSLTGELAIDRATALVELGREGEAESALAEARETVPGNAQAWLLSATLARRTDRLADAQQYIERAARLLPVDLDIGLEAGVIAVLSGRSEAARKSWQSVIDAAPESSAAATARGYLEQLGTP